VAVRRTAKQNVTRRTAARRARKHEAAAIAKEKAKQVRLEPESIGQAKVWQRKLRRYQLAGLCDACAAQAAWGHACGFQKIRNPCIECQPLVNSFPDPGPSGSKWRKCLVKLEYLSEQEIAEVFA
jgi:hypothetical protein